MSLRRKTQVIILIVLVVLVIAFALISQTTLSSTFEAFEQQSMLANLDRLQGLIDDDAATLNISNRDYAMWDDAYQFIADLNEDYVISNHGASTFENLNIDMMLYFNLEGNLIYSQTYNPLLDSEPAEAIEAEIQAYPQLFTLETPETSAFGVIEMFEQPAIVSMTYVLPSDRMGSPRGYYLFGRLLTSSRIQGFADALELDVALVPLTTVESLGNPALSSALAELQGADSSGSVIRIIDDFTVQGYTLIPDLAGSEFLIGRVSSPRDIFLQGQTLTNTYLIVVAAAGALFGLTMFLLFELVFVRRLTALNAGVREISRSGSAVRMPDMGKDEIGELAGNINGMLEAIERTKVEISETNTRLSTILSSAPIALWSVDETGTIRVFEGRGQEALRLNAENALGKRYTEVFLPFPQVAEETRRALNGETVDSTVSIRDQVFEILYTPVKGTGSSGRYSAIVVAIDVSDRARTVLDLQARLREMETQANELRRARAFASSSLTVVQSMIEKEAGKPELLEYVKTAIARMDFTTRERE